MVFELCVIPFLLGAPQESTAKDEMVLPGVYFSYSIRSGELTLSIRKEDGAQFDHAMNLREFLRYYLESKSFEIKTKEDREAWLKLRRSLLLPHYELKEKQASANAELCTVGGCQDSLVLSYDAVEVSEFDSLVFTVRSQSLEPLSLAKIE